MIRVEHNPRDMLTTVRTRNSVGGWSVVRDENGRPANYEPDYTDLNPKSRSFEHARDFFEAMDRRFANWFGDLPP